MKASVKNFLLKHPLFLGLAAFAFVFLLSQTLTYQHYLLLKSQEQTAVANHALWVEGELQTVFDQCFSSTQTLRFIVEQYGIPQNFDSVVQILLSSHRHTDALQLVDSRGTITHVHPLKGNAVLGYNILQDPLTHKTALATIEKKDYFMAGPIALKQGGLGFVGRVPIYNKDHFMGFSAAVVKMPTLLRAIHLDSLERGPFSYQFLKLGDHGSEEILFTSKHLTPGFSKGASIQMNNAEWKLNIFPNKKKAYASVWLFFALGTALALLSGIITWQFLGIPNYLSQMVQEKTKMLKESREKFRSLIEQASDGIFMTSREGVIEEVNIKGAAMLGYKEHELIGLTLNDIYEPKELLKNPIKFKELWAGQTVLHERRMRRKNGSFFYGEVNAKMIPDGRFLGILRDITERRETRLQLEKQNLALEKTNAELAQFVYSASHDLRAPLCSLLGLVGVIKLEHQEPELLKKLEMMNKAVINLDNFINDIIQYSRNRHVSVMAEPIHFKNIVADILTNLWYLPNRHNIDISLEMQDNAPFVSDKRRVSILLNNLISNAIKYHDLEQHNPYIKVNVATDKDGAVLQIKDNGPGIPEAYLDKIFQMFYRMPSKTMGFRAGPIYRKGGAGKDERHHSCDIKNGTGHLVHRHHSPSEKTKNSV
jgi:PAS domain S-box-containing protein